MLQKVCGICNEGRLVHGCHRWTGEREGQKRERERRFRKAKNIEMYCREDMGNITASSRKVYKRAGNEYSKSRESCKGLVGKTSDDPRLFCMFIRRKLSVKEQRMRLRDPGGSVGEDEKCSRK